MLSILLYKYAVIQYIIYRGGTTSKSIKVCCNLKKINVYQVYAVNFRFSSLRLNQIKAEPLPAEYRELE